MLGKRVSGNLIVKQMDFSRFTVHQTDKIAYSGVRLKDTNQRRNRIKNVLYFISQCNFSVCFYAVVDQVVDYHCNFSFTTWTSKASV